MAKRVLFVLDHYYPYLGGVETLFLEVSRALAARGFRVTVLTLREPGTQSVEVLDGVHVVRVNTPPIAGRYWFILLAILPALRLAASVDIIHASGYASAWAAWIAGWWCRRPRVVTVHEVFADQWLSLRDVPLLLGWLFRLYEWLSFRLRFDRYLCVSGFTRDRLIHFAGVPEAQTSVIYNAIDYQFWDARQHFPRCLKAELGLDDSAFIYTCFSRPGVSKGVDDLVEAAALIRSQAPNSHLLLILSRDPPRGYRRILQRIVALGLDEHITIMEPVPRKQLPSYLLASDCIVVPSLSEGFGYSAVEAATLGCRVIATQGHAVEEVLGHYGTFVPTRNPQALADAVLAMARDRSNPAPMPAEYTVVKHLEKLQRLYDDVIQKRLGKQDER